MYTRSLFIEQTRVQIKKQNLIFSNFPLEKQNLMTSSKHCLKLHIQNHARDSLCHEKKKRWGHFDFSFSDVCTNKVSTRAIQFPCSLSSASPAKAKLQIGEYQIIWCFCIQIKWISDDELLTFFLK